MEQAQNSAMEVALNKALADRERIDVVIAYLAEQLGRPVPTGPGSPTGGGGGGGLIGSDPVAGVNEGEFYGQSATKASYEVLNRFADKRHLLKTKVIFDAVKKGGVQISTEEGLYTSLARSGRFKRVQRGLWGLSEWYGDASHPPKNRRANVTTATGLDDVSDEESEDTDDTEEAG